MIKVKADKLNLYALKRCIALDVRPVLEGICDLCQKPNLVYKVRLAGNNPEHERHVYLCFECSPTFIKEQG